MSIRICRMSRLRDEELGSYLKVNTHVRTYTHNFILVIDKEGVQRAANVFISQHTRPSNTSANIDERQSNASPAPTPSSSELASASPSLMVHKNMDSWMGSFTQGLYPLVTSDLFFLQPYLLYKYARCQKVVKIAS